MRRIPTARVRPPLPLLLLLLIGGPGAAEGQEPEAGTVRGVVYDSTAAVPLAGATVMLLGTPGLGETSSDGSFRIEAVPAGVRRLTFHHPRLDELGVGGGAWEVEVEAGEETMVTLSIPSAATLAAGLCRSTPGVLIGKLTDDEGGAPVGGSVTVRWEEDGHQRSSATMTDRRGRYVLCGLPVGAELRVEGSAAGRVRAEILARLPGAGLLARDVALAVDRPAALVGRVIDLDDGTPVEGVEVRLDGAARSPLTDADGRFRIDGAPPGRRSLELSHVAFGVHRETVEIESGSTTTVDLAVPARAFELEEIEVTAERRYRGRMSGFEERMRQGRGEFLTREQIAERENQPLPRIIASRSNSLRLFCPSHPGRNPTGTVGRCWLDSRRHGGFHGPGNCPMEYWVDGAFLSSDFDITQIDPHNVEAVEIYPGPSTIPSRFKVGDANCGVAVVWTREPGSSR